MKICVPSASLVQIGALTPLLPSLPRFQVSRKPSVISAIELNATECRSFARVSHIFRPTAVAHPLQKVPTRI